MNIHSPDTAFLSQYFLSQFISTKRYTEHPEKMGPDEN